MQTVTGHAATEDEIDKMIDTGESETIFQKAIMEQGRGHVSLHIVSPGSHMLVDYCRHLAMYALAACQEASHVGACLRCRMRWVHVEHHAAYSGAHRVYHARNV